jgi:hypothetical protein
LAALAECGRRQQNGGRGKNCAALNFMCPLHVAGAVTRRYGACIYGSEKPVLAAVASLLTILKIAAAATSQG